jgi:hypothetical protein
MNVKNLFFLKSALSLLIVTFYLSSWNPAFAADQVKPTISKKPALEKKQQTETKSEKQSQIFIETKEYDVGTIYEEMLATHDFIIKNKGEGDLLIQRVKPG